MIRSRAPLAPVFAPVFALVLVLLLGGCGLIRAWSGNDSDLQEKTDYTKIPPDQIYANGIDALNAKRYDTAVRQFDAIEQYYPYSTWATPAQLMRGFTEYQENHFTDAIGSLDRFISLHPASRDTAYAYYLRALCYYEQISDIQRDQRDTQLAMGALQEVINRYPDSAYARDAKLKIDLCVDHLAGKEMAVGRWYQKMKQYQAAIGRFQRVVDDYQTTNHVPEALARLTEIYLSLGMVTEARRTASVLDYNYPGSIWYQDTWNQLVANRDVGGAEVLGAPQPGVFARAWNSIF
jgi:outer membrane protein assembly factor BamD